MMSLSTGAAVAGDIPNQCTVSYVRKGKPDVELGKFAADVGEEVLTTKSFAIPDSKMKATVNLYFTDESLGYNHPKFIQDNSMFVALDVSVDAKSFVLTSPTASIAEVAILTRAEDKNAVRVYKFINSKQDAVVAECREKE